MRKADAAAVIGSLWLAALSFLPVTGQNKPSSAEPPRQEPRQSASNSFALFFSRDGQCVTVPDAPALAITGALTMEAWLKADEGIRAHYYNYFISKNMGDTGYGFRVRGEAGQKILGGFAVSVPFTPKQGVWTHVAYVLDGTEEKLYLNGTLVGYGPWNKPIKVNHLPLWIGSCPFGGGDNWRGAVEEVRIWAVARTQEEIRATMFCHLRGDEAGLRACWSMNEGQGQKLMDVTGNTPPGQLGSKAEANPDAPNWVPGVDFEAAKSALTKAAANGAPRPVAGPNTSGIALLPNPEQFSGKVFLIRNGDILFCWRPDGTEKTSIMLRLDGIACPKTDQPYAKLARNFTAKLALEQLVDVRIIGLDSNGLSVAEVTLPDGMDLARELLKAGLAWSDPLSPKSKEFAGLENAARVAKAGLWADAKPVPPWAFIEEQPKAPPAKFDQLLNSVVVVRYEASGIVYTGSGFFVNSEGLIITNHHVVEHSRTGTVDVKTRDSRKLRGKVLRNDPARDLALVQVDGSGFPYLHLQVATDADIGADVVTIGNPLGEYEWSMTKGIVSGFRNDHGVADVQTDAAINSGNSGGPLILIQSGKVIGVNTWKKIGVGVIGLNFAVSTKEILVAFPELRRE
ncbi:MAG: trypsin-like peptidase domain-containing protein [Terracidiphilus sp.]